MIKSKENIAIAREDLKELSPVQQSYIEGFIQGAKSAEKAKEEENVHGHNERPVKSDS